MKKRIIRLLCVLSIVYSFFNFHYSSALAYEENVATFLLEDYITCINERDIDLYIELFTDENVKLMKDFRNKHSDGEFFNNKILTLIDYKVLTKETANNAIILQKDEVQGYEDYMVFYTEILEQDIQTANSSSEFYCFLCIRDGEEWKISRVSVPNIDYIIYCEEGLLTEEEKIAQREQHSAMDFCQEQNTVKEISEEAGTTSSTLTAPTTIKVYFTKTENINYHGSSSANVSFNTYLQNVIPVEWIVSYYENYPAYLQAGAMASKMFAWYQTVNPQFNFAPYYSDVKDNSESQNYLCSSYSNLSSNYRRYVDSVISYTNCLALVTEESGTLFLVQYRSNFGTEHSGYLNQATYKEN